VKKLQISDTLALPLETAAAQTFAFIGRKRSGKTYAAGKLVELLLGAGVQVVILDTVGNWFGLRLGADGKSAGLDIAVLGGLRGDIPLEETSGELIANTLADTGRSAILDVSQFSKAARQRFATAFGERLWLRMKGERHPTPLMLVMEECQLIVPQNVGDGQAKMVGIYEEIVRLGGNFGIGVCMITQRPQSVNKEVLNQTECLFVFQTNGAQERDALKKWIVAQGASVDLVRELPGLPVGTAYVWSPQWLERFERVKVLPKTTFDASATPKVGDKQRARKLAPLDLNDLRIQMAETIERAKADDPKELRLQLAEKNKRIAELERAKATPAPKPEKPQPIVLAKDIAGLDKLVGKADAAAEKVRVLTGQLAAVIKDAEGIAERVKATVTAARSEAPASVRINGRDFPSRSADVPTRLTPRPMAAPPPKAQVQGTESIGEGVLRNMLVALAQNPDGLKNKKLALLARCSINASTFGLALAKGRRNGWIEYEADGTKRITDHGLATLGKFESLPTGQALRDWWLNELGGSNAESRILRVLIDAYPKSLTNEEISDRSGVSLSASTFGLAKSKLNKLELIGGGRGSHAASEELFA
jgi:hypothetical protein